MGATAATHVKRCLRAAQPGAIPNPAPAPDFQRHQRKCAICHHPDREAIEELFIGWHSADSIQCLFKLPDWSTMYRHARAAGLYERRRHNIRAVLDLLLEGVDGVQTTPMSIVNAVRAYACLTDSGSWVEPTKRLLLTTSHLSNNSDPPAAPTHGTGSLRSEPSRMGQAVHDNSHHTATASAASADTAPPMGATLLGSPAPARHVEGARGTGSQPVHSSPGAPRQGTASAVPKNGGRRGASAPEAVVKPNGTAASSSSPTSDLRPPTSSSPNRQSPELEMPVSHSKQTTGPLSNRQIPPHAQAELPLAQKSAVKDPKR